MSRIGRAPIPVPRGVEVSIKTGEVTVEGSKGRLVIPISERLQVAQEEGELHVTRPSDHRSDRAQHGLARSLINNAVVGVTEGFQKHLEVRGVGYRAQMSGGNLELTVGYSHTIIIEAPEGVTIETPEATQITVSGIDKQLVGQVAANIRAARPPDSYHGKGVRYQGEYIRLKPGKAAATR